MFHAQNKCGDQSAHSRSVTSACFVRSMENNSKVCFMEKFDFISTVVICVAEQAGLSLTLSQTLNACILERRPIKSHYLTNNMAGSFTRVCISPEMHGSRISNISDN